MAEKEIVVKVTTEADISNLEDLSTVISSAKESADELSESLDELSDADLAYLMGEIDDIPDGFYESIESAEELSDTLDNIDGNGLDDASGSADELSDSLDSATQSSDGLSESMGLIEGAVLMDVAGQVGQLGSSAEGMAQDMNTAAISVGQLATNAGVAEPQMVSLINNISNATFPQNEAMAYVGALNQMGVSADKLGDSATNMDRINDATGIGYQKVMNLTAGLQSMGISADNLPASFNAIAYAEANVYNGADTLAATLKTQAGNINEYGLSVDQVVVTLGALQSQTGLTGRKLSSELGTRLKECNGDVSQLEQSLGLANGTLSNASQLTGQYSGQLQKLADEEAEHKTWLDQIGAAWEDVSLQMSPVLEPMGSFMGIVGQAGSYAVGINGLIQLANSMRTLELATIAETVATKLSAAAQWLLNVAMDANPIMIVVLAIIALVAILGYLYFNNEQVRQAVDALGASFMWVVDIVMNALTTAFNMIIPILEGVWNYITTLGGLLPANVDLTGNQILNTVIRVMAFIATLPVQIGIIFINTIAKLLGFKGNFVSTLASAASNAVSNFMSSITSLPGQVMAEFDEIVNNAINFAGRIGQALWDAGVNAISNFLNALDRHSPGIMQREFVAEITEMGDRVPDESKALVSNVGRMAEDVVDAFNPRLALDNIEANGINGTLNEAIANINGSPNGTGGDIIVNVYGDIDNDRRIQTLVDAVRRELNWDNRTAGRVI